MIGKFIKKIWKDWPEYEMTVKAEDLNKYEDTLKEHDERLNSLKDIDSDMKNAKKDIEALRNGSQASEYANNLVSIAENEKIVGSIGIYHICQVGRVINNPVFTNNSIVLTDLIPNDEVFERKLLEVKISSRSGYGGRQYGAGSSAFDYYYDPTLHALNITFNAGDATGITRLVVIAQYTRETA